MSRTLDQAYRNAVARLRAAGLPTPELDARWLLADAAGLSAQETMLRAATSVSAAAELIFDAALERRIAGAPVDRILGQREFWGLPFILNEATLSPRPDTETLIEACLACWRGAPAPRRLLDLGVGSGAILVALLHEWPEARGVGVDLAPRAIAQAAANAALNGVADRASFVIGDWTAPATGPFDLIVSNPPYITNAAMAGLDREVLDHDPRLALAGGADGLDAYRRIIAAAPGLLAPGAVLAVELGVGQEAAVAALMREAGLTPSGPARRDLGGIPRALLAAAPVTA